MVEGGEWYFLCSGEFEVGGGWEVSWEGGEWREVQRGVRGEKRVMSGVGRCCIVGVWKTRHGLREQR